MLMRRLALVDKSGKVPFEELSKVAAAINLQVQRDLAPIWNVHATVSAVSSVDALPVGVCPVMLVDSVPGGEGGVHLTEHNQPYAMVETGDGWSMAASHEILELLVDPSGNHLYPSTAIQIVDGEVRDAPGKFQYLIEVCDPCEDEPCAYAIDDVTVSDFYTPEYFSPVASSGVRYSFTGSLKKPREVLSNGYLSWLNPTTGTMQQLKNFAGPQIVELGPKTGASLRAFVDSKTRPTVALSKRSKRESERLAKTEERGKVLAAQSKHLARFY